MDWKTATCVLAVSLGCSSAAACTLRLALINIAAPTPGIETRSFDLELAEAIMAEAKCDLVLSYGVTRQRRDLMFSQGQTDLILSASITPARQLIARFSLPYRIEVVRLFSLPEKVQRYAKVNSFDDILHLGERVLVSNGSWYGTDYASAEAKLQEGGLLVPYKNFDQGLRMLDAGRGGLIMGEGLGLVKAAAIAGVRIAPIPYVVLRAPVHLMLSRSTTTEQDVQGIDAAIARLEARGTLKAIRHKYCDACDPDYTDGKLD